MLVGDPQHLVSVEAGAVLGDIVGFALHGLRLSAPTRAALEAAPGEDHTALGHVTPEAGIGDGTVVLQRVHRFGEGPRIALPTPTGPRLVPPSRLEPVETVHAMTIHKGQGSQFAHSVVVLPAEDSLILSRELLYTGVTRAEERVTILGSEAAIRAGVARQVRRASGLRARLWQS